jgi:hypothetical protein
MLPSSWSYKQQDQWLEEHGYVKGTMDEGYSRTEHFYVYPQYKPAPPLPPDDTFKHDEELEDGVRVCWF